MSQFLAYSVLVRVRERRKGCVGEDRGRGVREERVEGGEMDERRWEERGEGESSG